MKNINLLHLKNINSYEWGQRFFLFGLFFLCSSIFISGLFLIPAFLISTFSIQRKKNYFKDTWNLSFFICGILIITNAVLQRFFLLNNFEGIWEPSLSIIGLANWIPFFWIFWASQPYLNSPQKRKTFALILISGTFPLIITGFGQFFFHWNGPFETLNGLIIWFQRPIEVPGGLSGLFSSQNYAGSWLNLVWPFCIALLIEKSEGIFKNTVSMCFFFSIGFATFLTYSRNAWAGLLISIPIVLGVEGSIWIIIFIVSLIFIIFLSSTFFSGEIQKFFLNIIPERIILEFTEKGYEGLDITRIEILKSALKIINIRPLIGVGAAAFTAIFRSQTTFYKGHSHNLLTELAISYGIPVTFIFGITIITIIITSFFRIFLKNSSIKKVDFYERAIWASTFFFFLSQLTDIQYFDGKLAILIWLLLASLRNINEERKV